MADAMTVMRVAAVVVGWVVLWILVCTTRRVVRLIVEQPRSPIRDMVATYNRNVFALYANNLADRMAPATVAAIRNATTVRDFDAALAAARQWVHQHAQCALNGSNVTHCRAGQPCAIPAEFELQRLSVRRPLPQLRLVYSATGHITGITWEPLRDDAAPQQL